DADREHAEPGGAAVASEHAIADDLALERAAHARREVVEPAPGLEADQIEGQHAVEQLARPRAGLEVVARRERRVEEQGKGAGRGSDAAGGRGGARPAQRRRGSEGWEAAPPHAGAPAPALVPQASAGGVGALTGPPLVDDEGAPPLEAVQQRPQAAVAEAAVV